jgi:hypothetical protein
VPNFSGMPKLNRQPSGVVGGTVDVSHQTSVSPPRTAKAATALSRRKVAANRGATAAKKATTKGKKAPPKKLPGMKGPAKKEPPRRKPAMKA